MDGLFFVDEYAYVQETLSYKKAITYLDVTASFQVRENQKECVVYTHRYAQSFLPHAGNE